MALTNLDANELTVVRECLLAAVESSWFPDWEFDTLFGLSREQVRAVLNTWPTVDESTEVVQIAINNSMNNVLGYPSQDKDREWSTLISVQHCEVMRIFDKWKGRPARRLYKSEDYGKDVE
jgi:hypothetical protein